MQDILLHSLFENGTLHVQDLERYIKEDIERYGNKISDLERKLTQVYNESVEPTALEDDALFEEEGALMSYVCFISLRCLANTCLHQWRLDRGSWRRLLWLPSLGSRQGIRYEEPSHPFSFVPWSQSSGRCQSPVSPSAGYYTIQTDSLPRAASNEPPPQYPPPPALLPFTQSILDPAIGLLLPFYRERLEKTSVAVGPVSEGVAPPSPTGQILPDEAPDLAHVKSGPLGQITQPVSSVSKAKPAKTPGPPKGSTKKKPSDDPPSGDGGDGGEDGAGPSTGPPQPVAGPSGSQPTPVAGPSNPVNPSTGASTAAGTASPVKQRKPKASKKKTGGPASEAPQAGPIVMATA